MAAIPDEAIDTSDIPEVSADFFWTAKLVPPMIIEERDSDPTGGVPPDA